ncbi:MAG TPA: hypothetical protein VHB99_10990, partial [Pirellulales bacterium]|nr:hypothetical protein [Pirellulales bacterium]
EPIQARVVHGKNERVKKVEKGGTWQAGEAMIGYCPQSNNAPAIVPFIRPVHSLKAHAPL